MAHSEGLTTYLYAVLSDVSHPLEGTFYLFLLAVLFRWLYPEAWNKLLKKIAADTENSNDKDE